jgi:hypothetical protein
LLHCVRFDREKSQSRNFIYPLCSTQVKMQRTSITLVPAAIQIATDASPLF